MSRFEEIQKLEQEYLAPTYSRFAVLVDHGKGCCVYDENGREFLDLTSGIGVNSLGYADEELLRAQKDQLEKLTHMSNLFYTEPMVKAAEALCQASGMKRVFFSNSGAEANEGAIKTARKYSQEKYGPERNRIITLVDSFHGRTIATLEATGQDKFHQSFFPYTRGFDYVRADDIGDLHEKVGAQTAAIMIEPIQGESGIKPLSADFVKEIEKICREKDILLILDEVQSGIGRTGKLFGYEHYGLRPDIVTTAKGLGGGLPFGAFLLNEKTRDVLRPGDHGSTFGGNVLGAVSALKVLERLESPGFYDEVERKGEKLRSLLAQIDSPYLHEVRGKGLMIGVEVDPQMRSELISRLMEKGLLVLSAGKDVIRLLPPLIITDDQIEKAARIFEEVFREVAEDGTSVETV